MVKTGLSAFVRGLAFDAKNWVTLVTLDGREALLTEASDTRHATCAVRRKVKRGHDELVRDPSARRSSQLKMAPLLPYAGHNKATKETGKLCAVAWSPKYTGESA